MTTDLVRVERLLYTVLIEDGVANGAFLELLDVDDFRGIPQFVPGPESKDVIPCFE